MKTIASKISKDKVESIVLFRIREQLGQLVDLDMVFKKSDEQRRVVISVNKKELISTQNGMK